MGIIYYILLVCKLSLGVIQDGDMYWALNETFEQNRTLKHFEVDLTQVSNNLVILLVGTCVRATGIEHLSLTSKWNFSKLYGGFLKYLCFNACTLRSLALQVEAEEDVMDIVNIRSCGRRRNVSVKKLSIDNCYNIGSNELSILISVFRCLESLQLSWIRENAFSETLGNLLQYGTLHSLVSLNLKVDGKIDDLGPLDPLLIGEDLCLEELILNQVRITNRGLTAFLEKLVHMRCLRRLLIEIDIFHPSNPSRGLTAPTSFHIYDAPEVTHSFSERSICEWKGCNPLMELLSTIFQRNHSLECFQNDRDGSLPYEYRTFLYLPLSWNKGGRKHLMSRSETACIQSALWPRILQRAMCQTYNSDFTNWEEVSPWVDRSHTIYSHQIDVVYWLIRHHLVNNYM